MAENEIKRKRERFHREPSDTSLSNEKFSIEDQTLSNWLPYKVSGPYSNKSLHLFFPAYFPSYSVFQHLNKHTICSGHKCLRENIRKSQVIHMVINNPFTSHTSFYFIHSILFINRKVCGYGDLKKYNRLRRT